MSRRAVLAGGALLTGRPMARAALPRVLKLACGTPAASALGAGSLAFAREVARLSEGELQIDVFLNGGLGSDLETLDGVKTAELDFVVASTVGVSAVVPQYNVFDIPFLFTDVVHARAVTDGALGQPYLAAPEPLGITCLAWIENGMRQLTNSRHPVRSPDDLRGLKLRLPQSQVIIKGFTTLGAQSQAMALPLVYGALQTGTLDGQENSINQIVAGQLAMVQKFLTCTAHIYSPGLLFASMELLATLSRSDHEILRQAALAATTAAREANDQGDRDGLVVLRQAGMDIIEQIDRAAFVAALRPAYDEYGRMFGRDTIDRLRA